MAPLGDRFSLAGLVCAAEKPGTAGLCTPKPCNHSCYATCAQTDVPTERPPVANQVGMNEDALSPSHVCDRQARHRGCLAMSVTSSVRVPDAEGFGSAGKERACTEQAPSGQQCALWCSCDLVGAVRARALSAWRPAEQAWKGLSGGWMAVCSWLGSCSPCWASTLACVACSSRIDVNHVHSRLTSCCGLWCTQSPDLLSFMPAGFDPSVLKEHQADVVALYVTDGPGDSKETRPVAQDAWWRAMAKQGLGQALAQATECEVSLSRAPTPIAGARLCVPSPSCLSVCHVACLLQNVEIRKISIKGYFRVIAWALEALTTLTNILWFQVYMCICVSLASPFSFYVKVSICFFCLVSFTIIIRRVNRNGWREVNCIHTSHKILTNEKNKVRTPSDSPHMHTCTYLSDKSATGALNSSPRKVGNIDNPVPQPDFRPQPLPPPRLEGEGSASAGCKRRSP